MSWNLFGSASKKAAPLPDPPQTPTRSPQASPSSGQAPRSLDMMLRTLGAQLQCLDCARSITQGVRCEFAAMSTREKSCVRCRKAARACVLVS
jgi:hypothetical protein